MRVETKRAYPAVSCRDPENYTRTSEQKYLSPTILESINYALKLYRTLQSRRRYDDEWYVDTDLEASDRKDRH
jgi:hypothetical protein